MLLWLNVQSFTPILDAYYCTYRMYVCMCTFNILVTSTIIFCLLGVQRVQEIEKVYDPPGIFEYSRKRLLMAWENRGYVFLLFAHLFTNILL